MSREFGIYDSRGFFHQKLQNVCDDIKEDSHLPITKQWLPLFEELYDVAYAIASSEAGDSGEYRAIMKTIQSLPKLKQCLNDLGSYTESYQRVAEQAVENKLKEMERKNDD